MTSPSISPFEKLIYKINETPPEHKPRPPQPWKHYSQVKFHADIIHIILCNFWILKKIYIFKVFLGYIIDAAQLNDMPYFLLDQLSHVKPLGVMSGNFTRSFKP